MLFHAVEHWIRLRQLNIHSGGGAQLRIRGLAALLLRVESDASRGDAEYDDTRRCSSGNDHQVRAAVALLFGAFCGEARDVVCKNHTCTLKYGMHRMVGARTKLLESGACVYLLY